jgi:hypothetical protein
MNPLGAIIGPVLETVGDIADDLFTSDEERMKQELEVQKLELEGRKLDNELLTGQMEVNKVEASNPSVFVAGARPFIVWVGGLALAYQFIIHPMLVWGWTWLQADGTVPMTQPPPPVLDAEELWVMVSGVLGVAGMRSLDKIKGVQTDRLQRKAGEP